MYPGTSLGMEPRLALVSTLSSPRLRRITLTFNVSRFVKGSASSTTVLAHKEWGTVEEVLLQLAARSRDVVKVVIRLLVKSRGDSVPKMLDCGTFMSRFKEVGKVEVRFL